MRILLEKERENEEQREGLPFIDVSEAKRRYDVGHHCSAEEEEKIKIILSKYPSLFYVLLI